MPLVIYPGHSRGNDSKNRPNFREKQNILIFVELDKFAIEIKRKLVNYSLHFAAEKTVS